MLPSDDWAGPAGRSGSSAAFFRSPSPVIVRNDAPRLAMPRRPHRIREAAHGTARDARQPVLHSAAGAGHPSATAPLAACRRGNGDRRRSRHTTTWSLGRLAGRQDSSRNRITAPARLQCAAGGRAAAVVEAVTTSAVAFPAPGERSSDGKTGCGSGARATACTRKGCQRSRARKGRPGGTTSAMLWASSLTGASLHAEPPTGASRGGLARAGCPAVVRRGPFKTHAMTANRIATSGRMR
jgi:hypothetical protein